MRFCRRVEFGPDQHFAIDHRPFRQGQRGQLGKALGDQVFAARPEPGLAVAVDQLRAHAIVLPFHLPVRRLAQRGRVALQLMGQEKGIGLAAAQRVFLVRLGRDQLQEALRGGADAAIGPAHQALRDDFAVHGGDGAQCACHEQFRDADAKAAANEFHQQEALAGFQLVPKAEQRFPNSLGRRAAQRRNALLDPFRQPGVAVARRRRQDVGDGFRQVADRVVAFVEQPVVQPGVFGSVLAQQFTGNRLARLAAGEKIHSPGRVFRRRAAEVVFQRIELAVGGGGFV
jgi:hypothetical protein